MGWGGPQRRGRRARALERCAAHGRRRALLRARRAAVRGRAPRRLHVLGRVASPRRRGHRGVARRRTAACPTRRARKPVVSAGCCAVPAAGARTRAACARRWLAVRRRGLPPLGRPSQWRVWCSCGGSCSVSRGGPASAVAYVGVPRRGGAGGSDSSRRTRRRQRAHHGGQPGGHPARATTARHGRHVCGRSGDCPARRRHARGATAGMRARSAGALCAQRCAAPHPLPGARAPALECRFQCRATRCAGGVSGRADSIRGRAGRRHSGGDGRRALAPSHHGHAPSLGARPGCVAAAAVRSLRLEFRCAK